MERRIGTRRNGMFLALSLLVFVLANHVRVVCGVTNPSDVQAIESLYASLGSPPLPGWIGSGGDPCGQLWQGVTCNSDSDVSSIVLNGANLGGDLGDNLGSFSSIITIDFSNNHIGRSIPSSLPSSLQNLFLADNNFSGSIPSSISSLTSLSAMSLNNNHLSGDIPDAFQPLSQLVNLDFSNNELNGQLPPSFASLSKLSSLHLQSNQLVGTLGVLQDLNLIDLNVEGNQFTGPIPQKLLQIPNFRYDANMPNSASSSPPLPSDETSPPSPPTSPAPIPFGLTPSPPRNEPPPNNKSDPSPAADAPSPAKKVTPDSGKKSHKSKVIIGVVIASVIALILLALCCLFLLPILRRRKNDTERASKRHQVGAFKNHRDNHRANLSPPPQPRPPSQPQPQFLHDIQKVPQEAKKAEDIALPKPTERDVTWANRGNWREQTTDVTDVDNDYMSISSPPPTPPHPPSPPRPPSPPVEKVIVAPILPVLSPPRTLKGSAHTSVKFFTIASLQEYTNSFSQDNLIGSGMLGSVYKAALPDGSLLAVKKLDKKSLTHLKEDEFIDLVNSIDRIRHPNVVELTGYCTEHGEKLLIYEFCSNGTLQDSLHSEDELKKKLSWNTRIKIALGAARALEYLHEVCQPPVVHRNFKSGNIILDNDLNAHVADCGSAPLIMSGSVSQLSGQLLTAYGYGAPEFESGVYTTQSDVYSFGVVMLELLTGRQSYDKTRVRGEQFVVRWAIPQLHDIDTLSKMVDPSLKGEYSAKSLSRFADVISRCVQSEPEFRPQMSEVVQDLSNVIRREWSSNESIED